MSEKCFSCSLAGHEECDITRHIRDVTPALDAVPYRDASAGRRRAYLEFNTNGTATLPHLLEAALRDFPPEAKWRIINMRKDVFLLVVEVDS